MKFLALKEHSSQYDSPDELLVWLMKIGKYLTYNFIDKQSSSSSSSSSSDLIVETFTSIKIYY